MKRWLTGFVILLLVAGLGAGVARAIAARKAQQANAAARAAQPAAVRLEIGADDLVTAETRTLERSVAVSGTLKAANAVFVKARTAGELVGLRLREGDAVKAGEVVARIDPVDLDARLRQAQEQAESAKAQIDNAQRQWDNNKALVDQGFISRTALDTSWNNFVAAKATHQAALASVEMARKALDDTWLRAPISGVVAQRPAQPGERVGVDARVLEIVDLSRMELEVVLAPADALEIRAGQVARIHVEGSSRPLPARVTRINPSAQVGSRGVVAYLALDDVAGLRQGLFAQGRVMLGQRESVVLPLTAVRTDRSTAYVMTVDNGRVVHRRVTLGLRDERDGEALVAVDGLAPGSRVLRGSAGALRDGTEVRLAETAAASAAASAAAAASAPAAARP